MSVVKNLVHIEVLKSLKSAKKKSGARLWGALLERLSSSRSSRATVNVGEISRVTKKGEVVAVPGKVLGGGSVEHAVVIGAYSFSQQALKKIKEAGGKGFLLPEFVERFPEGKGVKLIG